MIQGDFRMKRRLLHFCFTCIAVLLLLAQLTGTVQAEATAQNAWDFGLAHTQNNETVAPSDLMQRLFGITVSTEEKDYLNRLSGFSFTYNDSIPDSVIATDYNGEKGELTVTAQPYSYTASNGTTVKWVPEQAELDGQSVSFDQNGVCCFRGLFNSEDFDIRVRFSWECAPSAEASEQLLNLAYKEGSKQLAVLREYRAQLAAFKAAKEAYDAYVSYLKAVDDYQQYLADCVAYDAAVLLYEQYEKDYAEYSRILQAYEDWRQYYAYQDFLITGLEQYNAYLAYVKQVEKVTAKLRVLEVLFEADSHGWQLYASLMGNTVTAVVDRKAELVSAGCSAKDIDAAGEATVELRKLMRGYADLRKAEYASEHDKTAALYAYYTANYKAIRDTYKKLYTALNTMYTQNPLVSTALESEGKLAHFQQFMGQLYITTTCLDDTVKQSDGWTISKNPLYSVVEEIHRVTDTNAANPTGVSMPETEVPAVQNVEPIDEPTVDDPIHKPTEPPFVEKPTEPTVVQNPDDSPKPDYAEDPGDAPREPQMDPTLRALADAVENENLQLRNVNDYSASMTLSAELLRRVSIENKKVITFYDHDRKTVLDQQIVEYGTRFVYGGIDVSSKIDAQYTYKFYRWEFADGTAPLNLVATSDMTLYAKYNTTVRFYDVTWIVDGVTVVERYAYNTKVLPIPPAALHIDRAPDFGYTYEFLGWDKPIVPVTGEVTYKGSMRAIPKLFTVTWVLEDREVQAQFPYGSMPIFTGETEYASEFYRYRFLAWAEPLVPIGGDAIYHAHYEKTPLVVSDAGELMRVVQSDDAFTVFCTVEKINLLEAAKSAANAKKRLVFVWDSISVTVQAEDVSALLNGSCRKIAVIRTEIGAKGQVFRISYFNSKNALLPNAGVPVTVQTLSTSAGLPTAGHYQSGEAWISFGQEPIELLDSCLIRVASLHRLQVASVANCNLSLLPEMAEQGALIDLRLGCKFGYEVSSAKVTLADGTQLPLKQLTFEMPNEAVSIELTVTQIVYRVTFVSDGVILDVREYLLGEAIIIPDDPFKASDGEYDYTFAGWSKDATLAIGDDRAPIYEAIFTATPITTEDPYQSGHNNNMFFSVVLPILLVIAVLIAVWVMIVRRMRRNTKQKTAQKANVTRLRTVTTQADPARGTKTVTKVGVAVEKKPAKAKKKKTAGMNATHFSHLSKAWKKLSGQIAAGILFLKSRKKAQDAPEIVELLQPDVSIENTVSVTKPIDQAEKRPTLDMEPTNEEKTSE